MAKLPVTYNSETFFFVCLVVCWVLKDSGS